MYVSHGHYSTNHDVPTQYDYNQIAILNTIISILFEVYVIIVTWIRTFWVLRSLRKTSSGHTTGVTYFLLRDGEFLVSRQEECHLAYFSRFWVFDYIGSWYFV